MQEVGTVSLTPNCMLIRRDGHESAIEDSAAPIRDHLGQVTGAVMIFHDVSEARAMSLRMSYLAQHDSLTGLPNRVVFNDRLQQAMVAADRQRERVAVLYLDLDRFKRINDTLGHSMGDDLLRVVAKRLCSCVRASDTVSRQGGDEFVVLLPQITGIQDAEVIANAILAALREPCDVERHELNPMASIGIAIYPDDGVEAAALVRNADLAMYQAKNAGRGTFRFYKSDTCKPVTARVRDKIHSAWRTAAGR
jgi:diguanylate cyclase (GGDEF)-like protein